MAEKSYIPNHLYESTIEEMIPDDIHYLEEDMLYCDKTDRQAYIYKKDELEKDTVKPRQLLGRFGLMRVMTTDDNDNLIDGYIADLRFVESPIEPMDLAHDMPDDCEDAQSWLKEKPNYIALLAVMTKAKKKNPVFSGDERFTLQMNYLTKNTDALMQRNKVDEKKAEVKLNDKFNNSKKKAEPIKNKKKVAKKASSKNNKK